MKVNATASITILASAFLLFTLLNQLILPGARIDLTENRLYTLSDGTKEILSGIKSSSSTTSVALRLCVLGSKSPVPEDARPRLSNTSAWVTRCWLIILRL